MSERYSHRNGETEPPTLNEEYFWFRFSNDESPIIVEGMFFMQIGYEDDSIFKNGVLDTGGEFKSFDELPLGQWWGPVTPPWEQDA